MTGELIPAVVEKEAGNSAALFQRESSGAIAIAEAYLIDSPEMYELAARERNDNKARIKKLDEVRLSFTRPLDELKEKWMSLFKPARDEYSRAVQILDGKLLKYEDEQREIARRAEEEARRRQEEDRARARQAEEEARLRAKEATKAGNPEAIAEAESRLAEVSEQVAVTEHIPAPVVAPAIPKGVGVSSRGRWIAEVVDLMELVKAVAAGTQPISLLEPNMKALNGMATSLKQHMNVPGVKAVEKRGITGR